MFSRKLHLHAHTISYSFLVSQSWEWVPLNPIIQLWYSRMDLKNQGWTWKNFCWMAVEFWWSKTLKEEHGMLSEEDLRKVGNEVIYCCGATFRIADDAISNDDQVVNHYLNACSNWVIKAHRNPHKPRWPRWSCLGTSTCRIGSFPWALSDRSTAADRVNWYRCLRGLQSG